MSTISSVQLINSLQKLPQDKQEQLESKFLTAIELGIRVMVIKELNSINVAEFEEIVEQHDKERLSKFMEKYIPNCEQKIEAVIERVTEAFLQDVKNYSNV